MKVLRLLVGSVGLGLVLTATGCSSTPPPPSIAETTGPHGGKLAPIPEGQGFVEVSQNAVGKSANRINVYFLDQAKTGSFASNVSDVNLKVEVITGKPPETYPLTALPNASDPMGKSLFVTKAGVLIPSGVPGEITAKVGGKEVSAKFEIDR